MKGLFLPGFKMPKCCECCIANDDNWKCNVLDRIFDYENMDEKRFDDCPLIEVGAEKTEVTESIERPKSLGFDTRPKWPF